MGNFIRWETVCRECFRGGSSSLSGIFFFFCLYTVGNSFKVSSGIRGGDLGLLHSGFRCPSFGTLFKRNGKYQSVLLTCSGICKCRNLSGEPERGVARENVQGEPNCEIFVISARGYWKFPFPSCILEASQRFSFKTMTT